MTAADRAALAAQYRALLLDGIAPFWLNRGLDREHGGVLTCMTEDGRILSGDKYLWSQARSLWTFSALYNRIERRPEFLDAARNSLRFLLEHGRDLQGRWVFHTTREGRVVEGAVSIFSDCFAVYGINEFCRAAPDPDLLGLARATFDRIRTRVEEPDFCEVAPMTLPAGLRPHAVPMILTEVANELGDVEAAAGYARTILDRFVRPQRHALLEYLTREYEEAPPPEGTLIEPGHAIESMWFVLHVARKLGDTDMMMRALEVLRWHIVKGWDDEYGGLFLFRDADLGVPTHPHWDKKIWWPHTEALYALLLAWELTGQSWYLRWYWRIHDYAFARFAMPETGEWRQRLDREGNPIEEVVALPVKDPFHLPRAAILIVELLSA